MGIWQCPCHIWSIYSPNLPCIAMPVVVMLISGWGSLSFPMCHPGWGRSGENHRQGSSFPEALPYTAGLIPDPCRGRQEARSPGPSRRGGPARPAKTLDKLKGYHLGSQARHVWLPGCQSHQKAINRKCNIKEEMPPERREFDRWNPGCRCHLNKGNQLG